MNSPRRLAIAAMVAGTFAVGVSPVRASDDIAGSMTAYCLVMDCSEVVFHLGFPGQYYLQTLNLDAAGTPWVFGAVVALIDGDGTDLLASGDWIGTVSNTPSGSSSFSFDAVGQPWQANTPLTVRMQMMPGGTGTAGELVNGTIAWNANGYTDPNSLTGYFSSNGTVTPEPATTALLGTGLIGLLGAGVLRRRRKGVEEFEET